VTNSKYKPFMAYLEPDVILKLKRFSKKSKTTMTEIVRQALNAKMAEGDPYIAGFNDGIRKAVTGVNNTQGAQMMFPSGKSFAQLVTDEIETYLIKENN
jgi:hypothetical protein